MIYSTKPGVWASRKTYFKATKRHLPYAIIGKRATACLYVGNSDTLLKHFQIIVSRLSFRLALFLS